MKNLKNAIVLLSSEYAVMSSLEDKTPHIIVFSLWRNVSVDEIKTMLENNNVKGLRVINHIIPIHHRDSVLVEMIYFKAPIQL